jgi:DNA processing protein
MIVNMLKLGGRDFPEILTTIPYPPKQLYWSGQPPAEWLDKPKVAVVGGRKITPYGKAVTERLVSDLARAGVVIISGLAFGVDVTAHNSALTANGLTVAVLASGLDNITPRSNYQTGQRILQTGTLISERPAGSLVNRGLFVMRNRIISGLADIVLIPEAGLKSGSLHTARFALEQGKTVMAVPGNITSPMSEGCNNLIKSGAVPVTSADDILFALNIKAADKPQPVLVSEDEKRIYTYIKDGLSSQDEIAAASRIAGPQLASALTMLEIAGHIRPAGGGNWVAS